jgi:hypothetical protein
MIPFDGTGPVAPEERRVGFPAGIVMVLALWPGYIARECNDRAARERRQSASLWQVDPAVTVSRFRDNANKFKLVV